MTMTEYEATLALIKYANALHDDLSTEEVLRAMLISYRYTAIRAVHERGMSGDDVHNVLESTGQRITDMMKALHPAVYAPPPLTPTQLLSISEFFGVHGEA